MNEKFNELPEEKRLRIVNAGLEVFSKSEYRHASTDLIAAKAGISKGLLFYYFHNKKELYMFLYEYAYSILKNAVLDARFFEFTDIFELLEYTTVSKYKLLKASPYILDFTMRMYRSQNEEVTDDINKKWQDVSAEMLSVYFKNMDYSKFREDVDPKEIIQMLMWLAEGYLEERRRYKAGDDLDDLLEKYERWKVMLKRIAYKEDYQK